MIRRKRLDFVRTGSMAMTYEPPNLQNLLAGRSRKKPIVDDVDTSLSKALDSLCPNCTEQSVKRKDVQATEVSHPLQNCLVNRGYNRGR